MHEQAQRAAHRARAMELDGRTVRRETVVDLAKVLVVHITNCGALRVSRYMCDELLRRAQEVCRLDGAGDARGWSANHMRACGQPYSAPERANHTFDVRPTIHRARQD